MSDGLTSRMGRAWIQKSGANSAQQMIECASVGDISEGSGGRELILCFNTDGEYEVKGATQGPPEVISYSVENLLTKDQSIFEELKKCPFAVYVNQVECGRQDDPDNYVRQLRLTNNLRTNATYVGMVGRNEDAESMFNLDIEALPRAAVFLVPVPLRMTTTEAQALNDIRGNDWFECNADCETPYDVGDRLVAAADAVGAGTANLDLSADAGVTWAAGGTDPLAADAHAMSLVRIRMSGNTIRTVVSRDGGGATQGVVAYGDSVGTALPSAWTSVNIGGAAAGHGAAYGGGMWAKDRYNLWLAGGAGYIYKSIDGGGSWTAKESAGIAAGDYYYCHFDKSGKYGVAVGEADVVALSGNGGESWQVGTATGAAAVINCAWRLSKNKIWAGTANGRLYYSNDAGVTWTQRTGWTGSGVGQVRDMFWLEDGYTGYMAVNNAAPLGAILRTTNGGYTWNVIAGMPANDGINKIWIAKNNVGYAVGEVVDAGTAFIIKFVP